MKTVGCFVMSIMFISILYSCREHYTAPVVTTGLNYLVVEGVINPAADTTTTIKLSRTTNLSNNNKFQGETKAQISVESDANVSYPLKETTPAGTYTSVAPLNLNKAAKYRVRIITADHKTYLSDFVPAKDAPPIDTVVYRIPSDGIQIFVSAHDATNNTRYYRYEYVETWTFNSYNKANYMVVNKQILPRSPENQIYTCWTNNYSTDIVLGSTSKLTRDILTDVPVTNIPAASAKLRFKYSILVKEYALTEDAFNFWQLLKKNTEQLGSMFDAQPSFAFSNIHNINNAAEPVLGYISVGTVQQKRIFISRAELPGIIWGTDDPYLACYPSVPSNGEGPIPVSKSSYQLFYNQAYYPLGIFNIEANGDTTFLGAPKECTDCTLRGFNKKPFFWK